MSELVEIVHPPTGVRAWIKPRVVPGWQRLGWDLVDDTDAVRPVRRGGAHQLPATVPGTPDGLAAGSSTSDPEGAQP